MIKLEFVVSESYNNSDDVFSIVHGKTRTFTRNFNSKTEVFNFIANMPCFHTIINGKYMGLGKNMSGMTQKEFSHLLKKAVASRKRT